VKRTGLALSVAFGLASLITSSVAAETACDRECLYGFVDRYLAAMVAHDSGKLPLAPNVKFTENQTVLQLGEGAWRSAKELGSYQLYAADVSAGQVGFIGVLKGGETPTLFALRLKISDRRIAEIETVVPGDTIRSSNLSGFLNAPATLVTTRAGLRSPLPASDRVSHSALVAAANSYYEGVENGDGNSVAFSDECHRMENGVPLVNNPSYDWPAVSPTGKTLPRFASMGCREQFNTHIWTTDSISDRRYPLVDEEQGIVFGYTLYHQFSKKQCAEIPGHGAACPPQKVAPFTLALVEAFKIRRGKIHEMESVWAILPKNMEKGAW
jgi:hypothetical protein